MREAYGVGANAKSGHDGTKEENAGNHQVQERELMEFLMQWRMS